jgi:hypothetical protein
MSEKVKSHAGYVICQNGIDNSELRIICSKHMRVTVLSHGNYFFVQEGGDVGNRVYVFESI